MARCITENFLSDIVGETQQTCELLVKVQAQHFVPEAMETHLLDGLDVSQTEGLLQLKVVLFVQGQEFDLLSVSTVKMDEITVYEIVITTLQCMFCTKTLL